MNVTRSQAIHVSVRRSSARERPAARRPVKRVRDAHQKRVPNRVPE
jgi:hypothetical protein